MGRDRPLLAGDLVQWHPHLHLLTTDGGKTADGSWRPLPEWDGLLLMGLFRERLLARLIESHAVSPELVSRLVTWNHPGFSTHVGEPIEPGRKQLLEDTAAYLVRNPLSLKRLVYLDGERAGIYRSRMNLPGPPLGRAHRRARVRRAGRHEGVLPVRAGVLAASS